MPDRLVSVTVAICRPCIAGEGDECHTPGCTYWMQDPPSEAVSQRLRDMLAVADHEPPDEDDAKPLAPLARDQRLRRLEQQIAWLQGHADGHTHPGMWGGGAAKTEKLVRRS